LSGLRVAVVGATGAVGHNILQLLEDRRFPAEDVVPFASERSAGRRVAGRTVHALREDAIDDFDLALFSAGGTVSGEWAPKFADRGAVVVDNSSRWRMNEDVPLVVAEVNPEALDGHRGIVANPNCTIMQALLVLKPLLDAVGLERVILSSYQSVSGTGLKAVEELKAQARAILDQVESFKDGDDYTTEERKTVNESRKILGVPDLPVSATCVRVPVLVCHSESLNVQTRDELSPDDCRALLAAAPNVIVEDDPAHGRYPLARDVAGRDEVFVGRIRRDPSHPRALNLWVVGDNLRKGAATNAVQVAELLVERGLVRGGAARAA
jgi:aspartate-semialdehyde dehydrogenase